MFEYIFFRSITDENFDKIKRVLIARIWSENRAFLWSEEKVHKTRWRQEFLLSPNQKNQLNGWDIFEDALENHRRCQSFGCDANPLAIFFQLFSSHEDKSEQIKIWKIFRMFVN